MSYTEAEIKKYFEIIKKYTKPKEDKSSETDRKQNVGIVKNLNSIWSRVLKFVRIADLRMVMFLAFLIKEITID